MSCEIIILSEYKQKKLEEKMATSFSKLEDIKMSTITGQEVDQLIENLSEMIKVYENRLAQI